LYRNVWSRGERGSCAPHVSPDPLALFAAWARRRTLRIMLFMVMERFKHADERPTRRASPESYRDEISLGVGALAPTYLLTSLCGFSR
jgi:hypothetical protein